MVPQDNVVKADGLSTNDTTYAIFYPYDGLLQGGYAERGDAEQELANLRVEDNRADVYVDAYVVEVSIYAV